MYSEELENLAELFERASLVMIIHGDKKAGLGRDLQNEVVKALRLAAYAAKKMEEEEKSDAAT